MHDTVPGQVRNALRPYHAGTRCCWLQIVVLASIDMAFTLHLVAADQESRLQHHI